MPIAGQPADIKCVEKFHVPAEVDGEMAGAPADSEAIVPAVTGGIQLMLHPRIIGNPTNMELSDDGPSRGNPRDVSDLSERVQYELGRNEELQCTF
eukprot:3389258-Pyramimonas_sp.AAC.1